MKKLIFCTLLFLPLCIMAATSQIPTVEIKVIDECKDKSIKVPLLQSDGHHLNSDGIAARKIQNLNYSCFEKNMKEEELSTITNIMKKTYSSIDTDQVKLQYEKSKLFQKDPNYVESASYDKPETYEFFKDVEEGRTSLRYKPCYASYSHGGKERETLEKQFARCSKIESDHSIPLICGIDYTCTSSPVPAHNKEEPVLETQPPIFCGDGQTIFESDSAILSKDSKEIENCINKVPAEAQNIEVHVECCSTTVRRIHGGNNLELTQQRQTNLKEAMDSKLYAKGFKRNDYDIYVITSNENVYYDATTDEVKPTGTCGPLTNKDDSNEPWVKKYKDDTIKYTANNNIPNNDPHITWITKQHIPVINISKPDSVMGEWRYNRVNITYQIKKKATPTTTVPSEIIVGSPQVKCLYAYADRSTKTKGSSGGFFLFKPWNQTVTRHTEGKHRCVDGHYFHDR